MRSQDVALQQFDLVCRDGDGAEISDSRGNAIHGTSGPDNLIDHGARALDPLSCIDRERRRSSFGDDLNLFQRQGPTVDLDHAGALQWTRVTPCTDVTLYHLAALSL